VSLGPFYENNGGTTTANVLGTAFDGDDTSSISDTLTILNVAPIITSLTATEIPNPGPGGCIISFSATAFDPGIFDILVFDWDLDNDGQYDDYTGVPTPNTLYGLGVHTVNVQVSDGDGGFGFASYTFECVPEPTTWVVIALSGGAMALATRLRRRKSA
ncbi:MAG: PKD domain-containing protein, partial [Pirellulales bacterium]|nr:PKD domain-containing protein [Pirellulales bacterium]